MTSCQTNKYIAIATIRMSSNVPSPNAREPESEITPDMELSWFFFHCDIVVTPLGAMLRLSGVLVLDFVFFIFTGGSCFESNDFVCGLREQIQFWNGFRLGTCCFVSCKVSCLSFACLPLFVVIPLLLFVSLIFTLDLSLRISFFLASASSFNRDFFASMSFESCSFFCMT